jgi:hypothetical protein
MLAISMDAILPYALSPLHLLNILSASVGLDDSLVVKKSTIKQENLRKKGIRIY